MCGIFGYSGQKNNAGEIVLDGLKRLDYRGYDSWGVAVLSEGTIHIEKEVGKISDVAALGDLPPSSCAIAHTRWATTGGVTKANAHPHASTDGSFVLAQNGIVENFDELKQELLTKHYQFLSETDTEVIVRLIEEELKHEAEFLTAVRKAFGKLHGRNTIIILRDSGEIVAARNGSPLVLGIHAQADEVFLSSDTLSFAPYAQDMIVVENQQMVQVNADRKITLYDAKSGKEVPYQTEKLSIRADKIDKEGHDHFMIKEIFDTPYVIAQIVNQNEEKLEELAKAVRDAHRVYAIGSGTAGLAAYQIAFYLRIYGGIDAVSLVGADSQSYYELLQKGDLIIAPSQSGETADVIEVLEYAKKKELSIASIVNMPGSMMTRMSNFPFMCNAGPEICVMSTKVFTSQIAWGYLLAKTVQGAYAKGKANLVELEEAIGGYLKNTQHIEAVKSLAHRLSKTQHIFLLGKYQNLAIINEGMVKLIEGTYKHAHAIPAGDLKHYAITLMEKGVPVIAVVSKDVVESDLITSINEVRLRGAEVIAIAHEPHNAFDVLIPTPDTGETDAISNIIPLQLLAYYMAVQLGNNVDKPRHIAKSVTVK